MKLTEAINRQLNGRDRSWTHVLCAVLGKWQATTEAKMVETEQVGSTWPPEEVSRHIEAVIADVMGLDCCP